MLVGVAVEITRGTWPELPIFGMMQELGNVSVQEMFRTFNMGIGMAVICSPTGKDQLKGRLGLCYEIGKVIPGEKEVKI